MISTSSSLSSSDLASKAQSPPIPSSQSLFDRRAKPEGVRVLVVDDSRTVRHIISSQLMGLGYEVKSAVDGMEALSLASSWFPDLIILDVDMPVLDGYQTVQRLNRSEVLSQIPVLFLSARVSPEDAALGLELGAVDYVRKPCEPAELAARVSSALRLAFQKKALQKAALEATQASLRDELTGLGNRRLLNQEASRLLAAFGPGLSAGVLMIDLDHFKQVNDSFGHAVGDVVLRIASERVASLVPRGGVLCRWGGEEFVALLTAVSTPALSQLAESFRKAVDSQPFAAGTDVPLPVSCSIGASLGPLGSFNELVIRADRALYEAKSSGRNRVCFS